MTKILVVDDEQSIRDALKDVLEFEGYDITLADDGFSAYEIVKENNFDIIFSDIKMPRMDGIELLVKLKNELKVDTPIVMISGHGTIETAVDCLKKGAYDFIEKPLDLNRLLVVVRNAIEKKSLLAETTRLKKKIEKKYELIGESPAILELKEIIENIAPTDSRVLITGQSGTGKEVVARYIHEKSKRSNKPFIEVNCAAISSDLIEAELFGQEKKGNDSSVRNTIGKFEQADNGTIFLDEIGEMNLAAQAKVLRYLEDPIITPAGSDKKISVNVRVIAATNKNLLEEVAKGNFREELYYRLNVIPINVPPLIERREDIPLFIEYFADLICEEQGITKKAFDPLSIRILQQRHWQGNIRELKNVVERLIILNKTSVTPESIRQFT